MSEEPKIEVHEPLSREETLKLFESDYEVLLPNPDTCYYTGNIYTTTGLFGRPSMSGRRITNTDVY